MVGFFFSADRIFKKSENLKNPLAKFIKILVKSKILIFENPRFSDFLKIRSADISVSNHQKMYFL